MRAGRNDDQRLLAREHQVRPVVPVEVDEGVRVGHVELEAGRYARGEDGHLLDGTALGVPRPDERRPVAVEAEYVRDEVAVVVDRERLVLKRDEPQLSILNCLYHRLEIKSM